MLTQKVTVYFVDGSQKDVLIDQWSLGQWGAYSARMGWNIDWENPGLLAVLMLRFQAWAELHRDVTGTKPSFDAWDRTVHEVEAEDESVVVDPTQETPSEG